MKQWVKALAIIALAMGMNEMHAQNRTSQPQQKHGNSSYGKNANRQPVYEKGGQSGITKYINNNLRYPNNIRRGNKLVTATVQYTVNKNGRVQNVIVTKSTGNKDLDREAKRVIQNLGRFTPATSRGRNIDYKLTQKVSFKIHRLANNSRGNVTTTSRGSGTPSRR